MKKLAIISLASVTLLSLAACSNDNKKDTKPKTEKTNKKKSNTNKDNQKKTSQENDFKKSNDDENKTNNTNKNENNTSNNNDVNNSNQSANTLPPYTDIHDFINKYGVSPKRYAVEHGIDPSVVPDTDKTSGELQSEHMQQHPEIYNNSQNTNNQQTNNNDSSNTNNSDNN